MGRKVDLDQLIDSEVVKEILGLSVRNSVSTYLKRYADFPRPVIDFADGKCRLWLRIEILEWKAGREPSL